MFSNQNSNSRPTKANLMTSITCPNRGQPFCTSLRQQPKPNSTPSKCKADIGEAKPMYPGNILIKFEYCLSVWYQKCTHVMNAPQYLSQINLNFHEILSICLYWPPDLIFRVCWPACAWTFHTTLGSKINHHISSKWSRIDQLRHL